MWKPWDSVSSVLGEWPVFRRKPKGILPHVQAPRRPAEARLAGVRGPLSVLREEQEKTGALPMVLNSQTSSQAQSFTDKHRVTLNTAEKHYTVNE